MKNNFLLIVWLLLYCSVANAQYTINKNLYIGKHVDGTPVKGTFINMNNKFSGMSVLRHYILLQDSKDGNIISYVFDKNDLHQVAQFKDNNDIYLLDDGYFKYKYKHTTFYDFQGKKLYTLSMQPVWHNDSLDVMIGYNHPDYFFKGDISAFHISTGKLIWKQKIPHRYHWPWSDVTKDRKQKNILYLITDSLVKLDVLTGKTVKMPFTAGMDEPFKSRFSLVRKRPIYRTDWKEAYWCCQPYIDSNVLSGTHSNSVSSEDSIFIADAKNLYCLDMLLNKRWITPLPADAGSKSYLIIQDDKILLINYGIAFQKGLLGHCGKPFVGVYDKHTGKQLSLTMPDIKNKISDGLAVTGRAYWQDDTGLMFNNQGETEVHRIDWKAPVKKAKSKDEEDECFYWPVDTVYQYSQGSMKPLVTDAHQLLVEANKQDVYLLKDDGTQQKFNADSIFSTKSENIYYNNAEKRTTYLVTDSSKKVLLVFEFEGILIAGDKGKLYAALPNGVCVIDSQQ